MEMNARHTAGYCIEKLGRNIFCKGIVVAFLFPAAYQVVTVFDDHFTETGYFIRTILQVCIHGDDYIAGGGTEGFV